MILITKCGLEQNRYHFTIKKELYMDFYIDIVISENDLDICGITEIMNTWEGKSIRKNPREFTKGSIKLVEIGLKGHGEEIDKEDVLKHVFIKALNWDKPIGITIKKDRV